MSPVVLCRAHPSLALLKYWGKSDGRRNLPATPSLAVTLAGVYTETQVRPAAADSVAVDGAEQPAERYAPFFDGPAAAPAHLASLPGGERQQLPHRRRPGQLLVGFRRADGSLRAGCGVRPARPGALGPGAPGFGLGRPLPVRGLHPPAGAGRARARQLFPEEHWPELRVLIAVTGEGAKPLSSRQAMEATCRSSPFYRAWRAPPAACWPRPSRPWSGATWKSWAN